MAKQICLFIIGLLCVCQVHAQIIDNSEGTAFTDENFFSKKFIKDNHIKSIRGSVATKNEGQPVIERDQFIYYEFDEQGRLFIIMSTYASYASNKDTSIIFFHYDAHDNLICKRRSDNNGFFSYNYTYDSLDRVVKETYTRDENVGVSRYQFQLGKQYIISSETFTYHQYVPNQIVKKYYNNYDKLYQETFTYYNELNYPVQEITRLSLSGKESKVLYEYNEKGFISKLTNISYIFGYNEYQNTFTYDAVGNVDEHAIFHNGKQRTLRSMIYDKKTFLMNAQVMKDYETGLIFIFKYTYTFF